VDAPYRKALVQITEWCNLHCAHCFVSAGKYGDAMSFSDIENLLVPRLIACRVISVSLTGGEPFAHERIVEIASLLRRNNIKVSICTNATFTTEEQMDALASLGEVRCNVSLDGFSPESHGKFRGDKGVVRQDHLNDSRIRKTQTASRTTRHSQQSGGG